MLSKTENFNGNTHVYPPHPHPVSLQCFLEQFLEKGKNSPGPAFQQESGSGGAGGGGV